jgi:hypothetical protein
MITLVTPGSYVRAVSGSERLKFSLAWLSFGFLVFPAAVLMSFGFQPKYVLSVMAAAIVPFQYFWFCLFQAREQRGVLAIETRGPLLSESADFGILMPRLVPYPRIIIRFTLHLSPAKLGSTPGNGRHHAAISFQDSEALSGQAGTMLLSPRPEVCYTRA